jgi:peptidoglycan/xylan/chitin deacetylase (PgdA/CDA1 family)
VGTGERGKSVGAVAIAVLAIAVVLAGCEPADQYPRREPPPVDATHPFSFGWTGRMIAAGSGSAPKPITLTFDDGPSQYTEQIISILKANHVPATFFVVGNKVVGRSSIIRDELAWGNRVGNHTWTHPDLTTLTTAQINAQIDQTNAVLNPILGDDPVRCLRPPDEAFNDTVNKAIASHHLAEALYDIDPKDWAVPPTATIVSRVMAAAHPNAIVLLHDGDGDNTGNPNRSHTVAALPTIIKDLRAQGYTFVSIC